MSKRFHASPKGMLAVLACLALLCSLFAFSLTVLADPAGDYTPSRYLKLSSTTDAQPQFGLQIPADQYPVADGPYTLSMKVKVENYAAQSTCPDWANNGQGQVEFKNGATELDASADDRLDADTEGYVSRTYTIAGADLSNELRIGFLFAEGDLYIADLVIKDKNDAVKYSLNGDDTLFGMATFANTATWVSYLYNEGAGATFSVYNEVEPATYEPTRYMKLNNAGATQPGYTLNLSADQFPIANGPYNLALNVKVENYETKSGAADWSNGGKGEVEIKNGGTNLLTAAEGSTALAEDTDGYVHYSFDLGDSPSQLVFGFCFGLGDLSIADLVIRDKNGVIRYSMNNDASLNDMTDFTASETCPWGTYSWNNEEGATFTVSTAEEHDINRDPVVIVTDAPVVELPDFDPGDAPTDTGDINRSITIVSSNMQTSTMTLSFFRDDAKIPDGFYLDPTSEEGPYALNSEDGPFYLVGKMKLTGFEGEKALISVKGAEKIALTADTDGWVDIKDADGNYLSLDMSNVEFMDGIAVALSSANGEFAIADLRIVDKDNNIVYSLANDTYLYGLSDLTKVKTQYKAFIDDDFNDAGLGYAGWKFDGKGKFNVLTKNDEYVPNKVLTMIVDEEHKAENPAIIFCNAYAPELFENGPYTITGKLRVDRMDRMDAAQTPTVGMAGKNYNVTNGWISFADVLGETPSFSHNSGAHWALISYYAYATVSVADVVIYDKDGEKVFDMATMEDEDGYYKSGSTLGGGYISLASYLGDRHQYLLLSNPEPVEHTTADYTVPVFEETGIEGGVPTPGPDTSDPDTSDKDSSTTPGGPDTGAETPILFCVVLGAAALGMALIVSKKKVRG